MTVCLFMDDPHQVDGHLAYCITVRDALTGQAVGSFVMVLVGNGVRQYITPGGQRVDSRRKSIDDVLRAVVKRPSAAITG